MKFEYETLENCPVCCGTGMDNDSLDHKCYSCNGTGTLKKKNKKEKGIEANA